MQILGHTNVANVILARLREVNVNLTPFVAGDIWGLDSEEKGINFQTNNLKQLRQCFELAKDYLGRIAFYHHGERSKRGIARELIRHAPTLLDMSFAATDGYGFREIKDMPLLPSPRLYRPVKMAKAFNSSFGFDDEQELHFDVTSLHAALDEKKCNVHIDEFGFVLRGTNGAFLNLDFGQHGVYELGFKEYGAPFLGKMFAKGLSPFLHVDGSLLGAWIAQNILIELPSSRTHYRPGLKIAVTPTPDLTISLKIQGKCSYCQTGKEEEERIIPIPDGNSVGIGLTYKFGREEKPKLRKKRLGRE